MKFRKFVCLAIKSPKLSKFQGVCKEAPIHNITSLKIGVLNGRCLLSKFSGCFFNGNFRVQKGWHSGKRPHVRPYGTYKGARRYAWTMQRV